MIFLISTPTVFGRWLDITNTHTLIYIYIYIYIYWKEHREMRCLKEAVCVFGFSDLLSKPTIGMNKIWEPLIEISWKKKEPRPTGIFYWRGVLSLIRWAIKVLDSPSRHCGRLIGKHHSQGVYAGAHILTIHTYITYKNTYFYTNKSICLNQRSSRTINFNRRCVIQPRN